jgi:hypothetical protein
MYVCAAECQLSSLYVKKKWEEKRKERKEQQERTQNQKKTLVGCGSMAHGQGARHTYFTACLVGPPCTLSFYFLYFISLDQDKLCPLPLSVIHSLSPLECFFACRFLFSIHHHTARNANLLIDQNPVYPE